MNVKLKTEVFKTLGPLIFGKTYHAKMGHLINYLLTGGLCRTNKYRSLVFYTALASSGCVKNLRLVFPIICSLVEELVKLSIELARQRFWLTFTILLETVSGLTIRMPLIRTQISLLWDLK